MTSTFEDKVALVTGGSSGIGRATAIAFGASGAKVVVASRRQAESEETCDRVREAGGEALFLQTDVADSAQVANMVSSIIQTFGRLDYAFNNAGRTGGGAALLHQIDEEIWDQVLRINLTGVMTCMKHEIDQMLARGAGSIVNMSSVGGLGGSALAHPAYIASKHGVNGLTKTAALQYAKSGIRINAVCPGWIDTPLLDAPRQRVPDFDDLMVATEPIGRIGTPNEVAELVLWLCSDASSIVTGQCVAIDGGMTAKIA
jgi:NAD(P)-dependent dehydrogenase (short-subunit alcohol dehydrogenase family)